MKRHLDPLRLDVAAFIGEHGELAGDWPGSSLDRLASLQSPPQDMPLNPVSWQARGERQTRSGSEPELWLHLAARTDVWLTCQRCLQPMVEDLSVTTRIRFVRGETQAEALDAELEEDVLALPRALDLRALVEDELLLALPLVPRHGRCPQPLPVPPDDLIEDPQAGEPAHPFAALQALKLVKKAEGGK